MVLRKSFYIRWSAGRSPRVHEVNPGRDPSQAAQDQRLAQCHSMLTQIMTHLGLPRDPAQREEPSTDAASLDVLAAAAAALGPPPPQQ